MSKRLIPIALGGSAFRRRTRIFYPFRVFVLIRGLILTHVVVLIVVVVDRATGIKCGESGCIHGDTSCRNTINNTFNDVFSSTYQPPNLEPGRNLAFHIK